MYNKNVLLNTVLSIALVFFLLDNFPSEATRLITVFLSWKEGSHYMSKLSHDFAWLNRDKAIIYGLSTLGSVTANVL